LIKIKAASAMFRWGGFFIVGAVLGLPVMARVLTSGVQAARKWGQALLGCYRAARPLERVG